MRPLLLSVMVTLGLTFRIPLTSFKRNFSGLAATSRSSTSFIVSSAEGMRSLGSEICYVNLNAVGKGLPLNVMLKGDVGAGKTTFSRGFVKEWSGDDDVEVTSPTYLIDVTYERGDGVDGKSDESTLHHMDLYRLKEGDDLGVRRGEAAS